MTRDRHAIIPWSMPLLWASSNQYSSIRSSTNSKHILTLCSLNSSASSSLTYPLSSTHGPANDSPPFLGSHAKHETFEMSTQHLLLHSPANTLTPNGSHHRRLSPRARRSIDAIANPNTQRARMQAERNGLPIGNGGQRGGYGMPQRMAHSPPKNKSMRLA